MDTKPIVKRLARTFGMAVMIAGGVLCGQAVSDALNGCPGPTCEDATVQAAIYAAMFCAGGWAYFWSRRA